MSPVLVDKRKEATASRMVFVNSVGLTGVRLALQRDIKMFNEGSCPSSLGFQFFIRGRALRVDCEIFVSRLDEEKWSRL